MKRQTDFFFSHDSIMVVRTPAKSEMSPDGDVSPQLKTAVRTHMVPGYMAQQRGGNKLKVRCTSLLYNHPSFIFVNFCEIAH